MRQNCDPHEDPEEDACLACLTRECCGELLACKFTFEGQGFFPCYRGYFPCVRDCFEAAIEDGSMETSEDITLACSAMCEGDGPRFEQPFLACAVGTPIRLDDERDAGAADGGSEDTRSEEDTCADVCRFPSWR